MTAVSLYDREQLYKVYYSKVSAYVFGKIQNRADAEDLVSDIFVKLYDKLDTFDSTKASLSTWIYTVTRNAVVDFYRSHRQTLEFSDYMNPEVEELVDETKADEDQLEQLADALEQLNQKERDLVLLHYYKGYTLKVVAQMMGMSYINAKVIHAKALSQLRTFMENLY